MNYCNMTDTSLEILNKQREILFQKSMKERFKIGAETIDFGRTIVASNIKKNYPLISEIDLKIAILKRYYEDVFTKKELNLIIQSMLNYHNNLNR